MHSNMSGDYNPVLGGRNNTWGPHPLIIVGRNDFSIFRSGREILTNGRFSFISPPKRTQNKISYGGYSH